MQYTCSNCQFVCHPDPAVRKRRLAAIRNSGVIIEDQSGQKKAVSQEEAEKYVSGLPEERRRLYSDR